MQPIQAGETPHSTIQIANRRSKPQLSCHLCRRRKLRCNRQQPCSSCNARGLALSCNYPQDALSSTEGVKKQQADTRSSRVGIRDRVVQLEQMVVSLIQNPTHETAQPGLVEGSGSENRGLKDTRDTSDDIGDSPNQGSLIFTSSEPQYVSGDHWAAILDSIVDLKEDLEREEEESAADPHMSHILLFYNSKAASKADILEALPGRQAVDRLVSQYFNSLDLAPLCLHSGTFLKEIDRQYERFWDSPSETPVMWLGLLFSILGLATLASNASSEHLHAESYSPPVDTYREKTAQCLKLGEYTKPKRYTFETMYNYLVIEHSIQNDANKDVGVLMGALIKLAIGIGYHRDPSNFPDISPFSGEIRRRFWVTLLSGDILTSTQMGMPRMIKESEYDTQEPRNLNDFDFDEHTQELPQSRPETENTTSTQLIARGRMFTALGKVVDLAATAKPYSYAEVMRIDKTLHEAKNSLPPDFHNKPIGAAVIDPPQMIVSRLFLRLMFHKGQIMLHRKYLNIHPGSSSNEENSYAYSRKSCLEAALGVLEIQRIFDVETAPTGKLHLLRWKLSSFVKHECLTATMVLCFLAQHGFEQFRQFPDFSTEQAISALREAYAIWNRLSPSSKEARTASHAIKVVLRRLLGTDLSPSTNNEVVLTQADQEMISWEPDQGFYFPNMSLESDLSLPFIDASLNFADMPILDEN